MSRKATGGLASALADAIADGGWHVKARPAQIEPLSIDWWMVWVILAGRGWGKTLTGASSVLEFVEAGRAGRVALIGATAADVRDTMIEGSSGILASSPKWLRPEYEPSKRRITWPNGAIATAFSSEEADRLRGPQHDLLWADELAAWNDPRATWDMAMFGLRIGGRPRAIVTTTPKPVPLLKELLEREGRDVFVTRGSTYENAANLAPSFLQAIREKYEGTRLGRQEINAELLLDVPGALWTLDTLDACRVKHAPDDLNRIVVAVDPAVSTNEKSDETGIVVAGKDARGDVYVLADLSGKYAPNEWAQKAVSAFDTWRADRLIGEANQGGQMVESTLRTVRPGVPYKAVHASRGKVTRAEPIAAYFEQRRAHHVGVFREMEDQMVAFTSDFDRRRAGYSPDRVDALVWALTELLPAQQSTLSVEPLSNWFGGARRLSLAESMPPDELARRGHYNPANREEWIRRGCLKLDGSPTKSWNGEAL